jgi:hypothetical protein
VKKSQFCLKNDQKFKYFTLQILVNHIFTVKNIPAIIIEWSTLKKYHLSMFWDDLWPKSKIFAEFGILVGK